MKITNRTKTGSGLAPENEPLWYKHLDVVFDETNEQLLLTSSAGETSFVNESNQFEVGTDNDDEGLENEDDSDDGDEEPVQKKGK